MAKKQSAKVESVHQLAVPVVPFYIQEEIHPQAIIDDLLKFFPSPSARGRGHCTPTCSPTSTACQWSST